jgi:hypothetical protein
LFSYCFREHRIDDLIIVVHRKETMQHPWLLGKD